MYTLSYMDRVVVYMGLCMIDMDILREEQSSSKKDAKCVVLLRREGLKKVVKQYNKRIKPL